MQRQSSEEGAQGAFGVWNNQNYQNNQNNFQATQNQGSGHGSGWGQSNNSPYPSNNASYEENFYDYESNNVNQPNQPFYNNHQVTINTTSNELGYQANQQNFVPNHQTGPNFNFQNVPSQPTSGSSTPGGLPSTASSTVTPGSNNSTIPRAPVLPLDLSQLRGRDPMAMLPPTLPKLETTELQNAFKAAKLALDSLGKRISNERKIQRMTENPSYSKKVHAVLHLSFCLGGEYLRDFCSRIQVTISSPGLLKEIAENVAKKLNLVNRKCLDENLKLLPLQPIIKSCYRNYTALIKNKANKIGFGVSALKNKRFFSS